MHSSAVSAYIANRRRLCEKCKKSPQKRGSKLCQKCLDAKDAERRKH